MNLYDEVVSTMYSERYPKLYSIFRKKYNNESFNFEVVVGTLLKHFPDLFQFDILEDTAQEELINTGSYWRLFKFLTKNLAGLHTPKEIVTNLHQLFASDRVKTYLQSFVIVPELKKGSSKQIAFLEKLAAGTLKVVEPLSFWDMWRFLAAESPMGHGRFNAKNVEVAHLHYLGLMQDDKPLKQGKAYLINFTLSASKPAKWGVMDLSESQPRIYCETSLTEREKQELQEIYGAPLSPEYFLGGTTQGTPPSTGYTALLWLEIELTKTWPMDANADFFGVLASLLFVLAGSDNEDEVAYAYEPYEFHFDALAGKKLIELGRQVKPSSIECGQIKLSHALQTLVYRSLNPSSSENTKDFQVGDLVRFMNSKGTKRTDDIVSEKQTLGVTVLTDALSESTQGWLKVNKQLDSVSLTLGEADLQVEGVLSPFSLPIIGAYESFTLCKSVNHNLLRLAMQFRKNNREFKDYGQNLLGLVLLSVVRNKAKQSVLAIDIPRNISIHDSDVVSLLRFLEENVYITKVCNMQNNASLKSITEKVDPNFARNKWLKVSG